MQEEHHRMIGHYKENDTLKDKATKKTIILQVFIVAIVCGMKSIQTTASLELNIAATTSVTLLLLWHFCGFKHRRALDKKKTEIVFGGVEIERQNPFSGLSFFQDYLKNFNVIGIIAGAAIFDFAFLYFFSVSLTQLLKSVSPEIVTKLAPSAPIRTFIISAFLGLMYYRPVRPLTRLKKELLGSYL